MDQKSSRLNIGNLLCSEGFNNNLTGDYFSKNFSFIEVTLHACIGKSHCASYEEVHDFMRKNQIQVIYRDTYSDKVDSKNYHKSYVNSHIYIQPELKLKKLHNFYIREVQTEEKSRSIFGKPNVTQTFQMGEIEHR